MTENDEQEHKHVEDDCKCADIKTIHVLTSNQSNEFCQKHLQGLADVFCLLALFTLRVLMTQKKLPLPTFYNIVPAKSSLRLLDFSVPTRTSSALTR